MNPTTISSVTEDGLYQTGREKVHPDINACPGPFANRSGWCCCTTEQFDHHRYASPLDSSYFFFPQLFPPLQQPLMASPPTFTDERFEEFQGAEQTYRPEYNGPPVSVLEPSDQLVKEYEDADQNFKTKIPSLIRTFPWIRKIRGDGSCGLRAICFGYFEHLIRNATEDVIKAEIARFQAFDTLLQAAEYDPTWFKDETFELLDNIQSWISLTANEKGQFLENAFNSADAPHLLFYFRLLASSQIKYKSDYYAGFLVDKTVKEFTDALCTPDEDIDQFAIGALYDLVLEPVGLGLQILDLNRSESTQSVNSVNHMPKELAHPDAIIRLLYRPGHYDLIYKDDSVHYSTTSLTQSGGETKSFTTQDMDAHPPPVPHDGNTTNFQTLHGQQGDGDDFQFVPSSKSPSLLTKESQFNIPSMYCDPNDTLWFELMPLHPQNFATSASFRGSEGGHSSSVSIDTLPTWPEPPQVPAVPSTPELHPFRWPAPSTEVKFLADTHQEMLSYKQEYLDARYREIQSDLQHYDGVDYCSELHKIPESQHEFFSLSNPMNHANRNFQPAILTPLDGDDILSGRELFGNFVNTNGKRRKSVSPII